MKDDEDIELDISASRYALGVVVLLVAAALSVAAALRMFG